MQMSNVRYHISKISIYVFVFCTLFLIQRAILFYLFDIKKYVIFGKIYLYEIILALLTFVEVSKAIKISRPE